MRNKIGMRLCGNVASTSVCSAGSYEKLLQLRRDTGLHLRLSTYSHPFRQDSNRLDRTTGTSWDQLRRAFILADWTRNSCHYIGHDPCSMASPPPTISALRCDAAICLLSALRAESRASCQISFSIPFLHIECCFSITGSVDPVV